MSTPRETPPLTPPERAVGLVTLVGLGLALAALVGMVVAGPRGPLLTVFWCGWVVMAVGTVAALFVQRRLPALARPLAMTGLGVLVVALSLVMEATGGVSMRTLRLYGSTLLLLGIGWALWTLGDRR